MASPLPNYVVINDELQTDTQKRVLRIEAESVIFPLSPEDRNDLDILGAKFDQEANIAGLAAPQIGIHKKMIIFAAPDSYELRRWRPEMTQTIERTVWLNAAYEPIGDETQTGYEGCFSVRDIAGEVTRAQTIRATAQTPDGEPVDFIAEGYLARIIQHEIDHTNGILFIDKANEVSLKSIEEYREMRRKASENEELKTANS